MNVKSANSKKQDEVLSKVPEITLIFWIIKILATTLGETGGDAVSICGTTPGNISSAQAIFAALFVIADFHPDIESSNFHPFSLLGDHYRHFDHGRNNAGRFCGPFVRHRLCRRHNASAHFVTDLTIYLVSNIRFSCG